ncbi:MAG: replication-associated recombination protein A [Syntrophomonadaceae bacterium]|nr:replication-associated recombination protein A [Syntrophomonadaceae bacterium]
MNLFENDFRQDVEGPLAYRMRPVDLEEYVGQEHLVGKNGPLRRIIEEDRLHSFILYGPPGSGKTTLALLLAQKTKAHFEYLKAVTSGVTELRAIARDAQQRWDYYRQKTIVFVDEVHRFNKSQQDVLLPYVESGLFTLVGATTENPLYELNSALLSRMKIYVLNPLTPAEIEKLIRRALNDPVRGLGKLDITLSEEALQEIIARSKGDARVALNILETACQVRTGESRKLTLEARDIQESAGHFYINYDKKADHHYDTISAFIKSIRGSDPDAALFWLAVMIHGGEDPLYIARRLVIHAAEDIGMADPQALLVAVSAFHAAQVIGLPEARIPLAEATIYLACAPKSNSSKVAIDRALDYVRQLPSLQVPAHIADNSHSRSYLLGKGKGYLYPHAFGGYVKQDYMPPGVERPVFYQPTDNGYESKAREFLDWLQQKYHEEGRQEKE